MAREQLLANRYGVTVKGSGPAGGHRADYAWAAAGAVVVAGWGLSSPHHNDTTGGTQAVTGYGAVTTSQTAGGTGTTVRPPHPTTRLGDLTSFTTIAVDVQSKVTNNDLPAGKARVKDLEVAWDDAEAGLKPRDAGKWHRLDDQIDAVLTALRAGTPSQSECASSLKTLISTLNTFDGI